MRQVALARLSDNSMASFRAYPSPNQIALVWALRGTMAAGMPLLCLPPLGLGPASHFIAIGALNTSMVDIGDSYRSRLNAMTFNSLISPLALVLGSQAREPWWLASVMMFFVALGSGLARVVVCDRNCWSTRRWKPRGSSNSSWERSLAIRPAFTPRRARSSGSICSPRRGGQ
jgi:hypothetical protein